MAQNFARNFEYIFALLLAVATNNHPKAEMSLNSSCGFAVGVNQSEVRKGYSYIEHFPWMGYLYYPMPGKRLTSAVVLVTVQVVLGSANEIDKLPKDDFRIKTRVVLGSNCTAPPFKVKEYSFHPEYKKSSVRELALIQLDVERDNRENGKKKLVYTKGELRPICPPPAYFLSQTQFYAMSYTHDCMDSRINLHKMNYVDINHCKNYYRMQQLDIKSMWPKHTVCAESVEGMPCVWRSGTLLVMKQSGRWLLLGFGIYGPGCGEPARFIDYSMYHSWVFQNIARMGEPAITRVEDNDVILRRNPSKLQRFGECDPEEIKIQLFKDTTKIVRMPIFENNTAVYNLTLVDNVEYSCIIFRVDPLLKVDKLNTEKSRPKVRLRRWCGGPHGTCTDYNKLTIDFYVEIYFDYDVVFEVVVYGQEADILDPQKMIKAANKWKRKYPRIPKNWSNITRNDFGSWWKLAKNELNKVKGKYRPP